MHLPSSFLLFVQQFTGIARSTLFYPGNTDTIEDCMIGAFQFLSADQRSELRNFLDDILARNLSDRDYVRIWRESGPMILIEKDEQVRSLFVKIRDELTAFEAPNPKVSD